MKLLLLKTLLQRRARDEGFTLPMVIALGLVMVLLGVISLTTANEENITAISQNSKSDALAIAEVGVARYRELLDRNRVLTVYDSEAKPGELSWRDVTEVCDNNIADSLLGAAKTITLKESGSNDLNSNGTLNDPAFPIGTYSLVSYEYTNPNSVFDQQDDALNNNARGILRVKGTAADGSEAQIQVEIPVRINPDDMTTIAPALWIGGNIANSTLGNLTIGNGNVVIRDQASADGCSGFSLLASTAPRRPVISDSRNLPTIQKIIDDVANASTALAIPAGNSINTLPLDSAVIPGATLFGSTISRPYNPDYKTINCSNIKLCRYYYNPPTSVTPLTYTNTNLLTDGIARTTLLLNQPLTINATVNNITIGSTSTAVNDSNTFEIYVNGNNNISINTGGRTITINAFIHAPQSTLTITGGGTVNINGSVWVNDFVNNGGTVVNISPDLITRQSTASDPSTSGRAYKFYSTSASRTPRPLTGSPTNWKTEEVN